MNKATAKPERGMPDPVKEEPPSLDNVSETLKLLDNVATNRLGSQRDLARKLGVSLGLVNALIHRAVRKGLVKIKQVPAQRYVYYLTPKGFAEKSRLVAEYLDYSLTFFRAARQEYGEIFARCKAAGRQRIILCGVGELAEIATLAARESDIEIVGVLDRETNNLRIAGLPVLRDLSDIDSGDVLVVTDGRNPQQTYDMLTAVHGASRVFAPPILSVVSVRANAAESAP